MIKAGLGIAALCVIVLSTVTTTFLDAFSAGVSSETIWNKFNSKLVGIFIAVLGMTGAILFPMDDITDFLYLIGSVFAPMISVLLADFFVNKKDFSESKINFSRIAIWVFGFVMYRILMNYDIPVGNTLPDMVLTFALCIAVSKIQAAVSKR